MSFNSDQAKDKKEQDALGFADSAEATAKSIFSGEYPDGFVIGIEGEWGSGKTSYINFIRESLQKKSSEFKIIEFKPWLYSSHENLIAAYFKLLSKEANDIFGDNSIKENLANVVDSFTPLVGTLASLAGLGDTTKSAMGLVSKKLKESPTLESQYEIIQKKLTEAKKPFVVIIDDLDRLDSNEVKTMLKLVKSVGRLPYVTYILAYDRDYVKGATDADMPNFLEKIIQLPISIPKPAQFRLITMLNNELNNFSATINLNDKNWQEAINLALYPYIKKPRDIILLANSIKFRFPAMKGILDPADLFILECLHIFDPELWKWIKNNSDIIFSGLKDDLTDEYKKQIKEELQTSFSILHPLSKSQSRILAKLFPSLSNYLEIKFFGAIQTLNEIDNQEKNNLDAVAKEFVYDAYFAQYLEDTEISQDTINHFLENTKDREQTTKTLRSWINKKDVNNFSRIETFFKLVSSQFTNDRSPKPNKMFLWSLTDVFNDINSLEKQSIFSKSSGWHPEGQLEYMFLILFKEIGKQDASDFLKNLCSKKEFVHVSVFLLHYIGYYIDKTYNGNRSSERLDLIDDKDWDSAAEIIAPHLKDIFLTGSISDFPNIIFAEFLAGLIFGAKEASTLFETAYGISEKYVIKAVKKILIPIQSLDGVNRFQIIVAKHPELFNYDVIAEHASKINPDNYDEETNDAIAFFLRGIYYPETLTSDDAFQE